MNFEEHNLLQRRYEWCKRIADETDQWSSRKLRMCYAQAWRVERARKREREQE